MNVQRTLMGVPNSASTLWALSSADVAVALDWAVMADPA